MNSLARNDARARELQARVWGPAVLQWVCCTHWTRLPAACLGQVLVNLDFRSRIAAARVCRDWYAVFHARFANRISASWADIDAVAAWASNTGSAFYMPGECWKLELQPNLPGSSPVGAISRSDTVLRTVHMSAWHSCSSILS